MLVHGRVVRGLCRSHHSSAQEANMAWTKLLAWGFVGFTVLFVMALLRLWWEERREVARLKRVSPVQISP